MALELLKEEDTYTPAFRELIDTRAASEPAWLRLLREKSFARFESAGLPTVKEEEWKYTNVAAIARANLTPALTPSAPSADVQISAYDETRDSIVVFVDGLFQPKLSALRGLPSGVSVMKFAEALDDPNHEPLIRAHFERYAVDSESGFTALNTAFAHGVLIFIPANTKIEAPIQLEFVSGTRAAFPRVLIVAEENSSATIVENYASQTAAVYLTNVIIDLVLGDGAHFQHFKVQRESTNAFHIATTRADLGSNTTYDTTTINFGAALSRHNIDVSMDHEGAHCSVDGLYMVDGNQHTDTHSVIDHRQPRCSSHQLYKGILDGKSRAVFNGKVFVRHGAQQTDAKQTNKNLLLSPEARVDTKPQLEIFADDVKCAHGAAVGQIDEEEKFYLESRGLSPTLARNLLTYGFAEEIIEKIKIDSIKRELDKALLFRLHAQIDA